MTNSFILFEVGGAAYAVRSSLVRLVEMVESITRVPNAPAFIEGIIAVRGQVIPVVSVRKRFQMDPIAPTLRTRLIVTEVDGRTIGLMVDTSREFVEIPDGKIQPPPDGLVEPGSEYLEGVANINGRLILVVDLRRLLSSSERNLLSDTQNVDA